MNNIHGRLYVPGGVALVKGRLQNDLKMMSQKEVELIIEHSQILLSAPFLWIGMIFRYGTKNDLKVEFQRINKKYGTLPIAVELDMAILEWADKNNTDLLHDIFMMATLEALIQVCDKYKLNKSIILEERNKYGCIPNTIEECSAYQKTIIYH